MPKGLPATYIKRAMRELGAGASWSQIFKRAWQIYKGGKVYKAVSQRKRRKRRVFRLARRLRRRKRPMLSMNTISRFIRLGAFVGVGITRYGELSWESNPWKRLGYTMISYAGIYPDGRFDAGLLGKMWVPYIATTLVTKGVQKLGGIIRRL